MCNAEPITREEAFLARVADEYDGELPTTITRQEHYLKKIIEKIDGGGSVTPEQIDAAIEDYLNSHDADIVTEQELSDELSGYYNKTYIDNALDNKADRADIPDVSDFVTTAALAEKQDALAAGENISIETVNGELTISAAKNYITPKMYGAKGDGVSDDTSAIQTMFNANKTDTIYFPDGKYNISQTIVLNGNYNSVYFGTNAEIRAVAAMDDLISFYRTVEKNSQCINGGIFNGNALAKNGITILMGPTLNITNVYVHSCTEKNINFQNIGDIRLSDSFIDNHFYAPKNNVYFPGETGLPVINNSVGIYISQSSTDNVIKNVTVKNNNIGVDCASNTYFYAVHPWINRFAIYSDSVCFKMRNASTFVNCVIDTYHIGFDCADYYNINMIGCKFLHAPAIHSAGENYNEDTLDFGTPVYIKNNRGIVKMANCKFSKIYNENNNVEIFGNTSSSTVEGISCSIPTSQNVSNSFITTQPPKMLFYTLNCAGETIGANQALRLTFDTPGTHENDFASWTVMYDNTTNTIYKISVRNNQTQVVIFNRTNSAVTLDYSMIKLVVYQNGFGNVITSTAITPITT